jgi:protein TonB
VVEELLRSAFWFNPAMWWLISQVQHTREEVVDATVVAFSGRRREYLDALLAFSDEVPLAPASAFSRRRHLFRRIMLLSTEDVMSARRIVFSAFMMAVTVLAVSAVAVRAFPMRSSETPGVSQPSATMASLVQPPGPIEQSARQVTTDNPIPKRVSGDEPVFPSIADGSDMSVTVMLRVTIDQVGNVAELRLGRFTFRRGGMSASVDGGGFNQFVAKAQLKDAPGGSVMTAESMRSIFEAFIETAADAVARWQYEAPREGPLMFATTAYFTDGRASTANTEATRRTVVNSEGALRVGANIKPPAKIRDVRPVYPPEALEARVQGVVIAEVRIEGDGRVSDAKILRSIPMLDQAALDAIHQWEFMPTLLNGAPVPMIMTVTVQFTLAP